MTNPVVFLNWMRWSFWSFPSGANGIHGGACGKRGARSRTIMGTAGKEAARIANPVQTTAFFGVKKGFFG
jgi:hypothetical protein